VEKWLTRRPYPVIIYGDATGGRADTRSNTSDWNIVRQFFIEYSAWIDVSFRVGGTNPLVRDRVNAVNGMLCSASGERRLFVHPKCVELKKDFYQVAYKKDLSGNTFCDLDKSDPDRTHVSDALGYFIEKEFGFKARCGFQKSSIV
jgi:hypothetical protein